MSVQASSEEEKDRGLGEAFAKSLVANSISARGKRKALLLDLLEDERSLCPALRYLVDQPVFDYALNHGSAAARLAAKESLLSDLASWCNPSVLARVSLFLDGAFGLKDEMAMVNVGKIQGLTGEVGDSLLFSQANDGLALGDGGSRGAFRKGVYSSRSNSTQTLLSSLPDLKRVGGLKLVLVLLILSFCSVVSLPVFRMIFSGLAPTEGRALDDLLQETYVGAGGVKTFPLYGYWWKLTINSDGRTGELLWADNGWIRKFELGECYPGGDKMIESYTDSGGDLPNSYWVAIISLLCEQGFDSF